MSALILGVRVDTFTKKELLQHVELAIRQNRRLTVSYANIHVLDQAAVLPDLKKILNEMDICYCDGKGVQLAAKFLKQEELSERITGADWIWDLGKLCAGKYKICWIAGDPGTTIEASEALKTVSPDLELLPLHGYFPKKGPENDKLLLRINAFKPDILLVGFGTPLQERWVSQNREKLNATVVWCLGATADFISGRVSRGPKWLHERQEWLARLIVNPQKLWHRYMLGNTRVGLRLLKAKYL